MSGAVEARTSMGTGAAGALLRAAAVLVTAAMTAAVALHAQTVSFAGVQTDVPTSGVFSPIGVAVDAAGNVFFTDASGNRVVEVSPGGAQTFLPVSGLSFPDGVAVDRAGDVYVTDSFHNRVVEVPLAGAQTTVPTTGLNNPDGLAVDGTGNLFIVDSINNRVVEVSLAGAQTTVPASGLNLPGGVAVDSTGNVFITDYFNSRVVEVSPGRAQTTVPVSGLNRPMDVAVDAAGNLFITDTDQGNSRVLKVPANGGAQTTVGSGLSLAQGVAVDGAGDVFIADGGNHRVVEVQTAAVNFGTVNVCPSGQSSPAPCSETLTLNYDVTASGTLGSVNVLTQGAPNLDFTLASGNTCTGDLAVGSTCTVNVTFAPRGLGLRTGAVQVTDASGTVLATTFIHGIGQGPAIAFGPGAETTVGSGPSLPFGVAVETAGNLFIADTGFNRVVKISPGGTQTAVGSGLMSPTGVAVDGAGDVFIAETSQVVKVSPDGTQTTVPTNQPLGVAVDAAGNLFIADRDNSRVLKVPPDGSAQSTVGSGLSSPTGVAVDGTGDVFIADSGTNLVVKVSPDGTQTTVPTSGLNHPDGLAVDAAGDVFIADTDSNRVVEVPSGAGAQTTVGSGLLAPRGVAVDATGNVFIADSSNNRTVEVNRSQPPALSFAVTPVGSTSADSPQSITIESIGNAPLVFSGLTVGTNFAQVTGSGTPEDCTAASSLAPGAGCNLSISFSPQIVGNIQSTAVLTDNALNAPAATQTFSLSGTGILKTTTAISAATGQYSDQVTLTAVVGPSGASFSGSLQFQVTGANACSVAVTGSGTFTCSYTIAQGAGTYSTAATLTSPSSSILGSTASSTLTVTKEDATITHSSSNPTTVQVNTAGGTAGPISLQGTLQQSADGSPGDLTKAGVTVTLVPAVAGAVTINCPVTNANGALTATCTTVPVGAYSVQWSITGDYYQGPVASSVLAIYDPSLGYVTGSGSVNDNGVPADFAISVKYLKNGTLTGGITYIEHQTTGDVTVSSASLSSMSLVGATAIVYAQAAVNGMGGYTLQLYVTDNGTPGIGRDTLGLQVSGGTLNPPISFVPSAITAGNIQTH